MVRSNLPVMFLAMRMQCIENDVSLLPSSTTNPLYFLSWRKWSPAKYLNYNIPFSFKSIIAQFRLLNSYISYKGNRISFLEGNCPLCNEYTPVSLEHLIMYCPCLSVHRQKCPFVLKFPSFSHFVISLKNADINSVKSVFYFILRIINAFS